MCTFIWINEFHATSAQTLSALKTMHKAKDFDCIFARALKQFNSNKILFARIIKPWNSLLVDYDIFTYCFLV